MQFKQYEFIEDIPGKAVVGIYGTGDFGQNLFDALVAQRPDVTVKFFLDSFKNGKCKGLEVVRYAAMGERIKSLDVILVASAFSQDILQGIQSEHASVVVEVVKGIEFPYLYSVGKKPRFYNITLEPTTFCNMDCFFCRHCKMLESPQHTDFEFFKSLVDQMREANLTQAIQITGQGEPLMYPHIIEAVAYVREKGFKPTMVTNALLLTPERYDQLVEAGIDLIQVSLHDLSHDKFKHRAAKNKMHYSDYVEQLFSVLKRKMQRNDPVAFDFILTIMREGTVLAELWDNPEYAGESEKMLEDFGKFADRFEAVAAEAGFDVNLDRDRFREIYDAVSSFDQTHDELEISSDMKLMVTPIFQEHRSYMKEVRPKQLERLEFVPRFDQGCNYAGGYFISREGYLFPCSGIPYRKEDQMDMTIGKIGSDNLREIFESERFQRMHERIKRGKLPHEYCARCLGDYCRKD
ncbi:radical SAM protein [Pseudodesulfovibrio sp.]|nr:radical SAM protein [Pseudodesulfovibrio sp.]